MCNLEQHVARLIAGVGLRGGGGASSAGISQVVINFTQAFSRVPVNVVVLRY